MIVFTNGTLVDPKGRLVEADVLVEDGMISTISHSINPPPKALSIDLGGRTLIPGLINLHSHHTFFPGAAEAELDVIALRSAANAARALAAGVTTARDVGGIHHVDIALREAIANGLIPGPRLLVSGRFICMTGGHSYAYGREADGVDDIRRAVREQVKAGADLIKFMGSGGVADEGEDPRQVQFTQEELAEGIAEAHRLGRKVAVHAHPHQAIKNAILAGADFIEHATFLEDETIDLLIERQVAVIPTFCVYQRISEAIDRPRTLRDHARWILDEKLERFSRAVQAGVRWGVGLDNGTFYPPDDFVTELKLLISAGIDVRDVLLASTLGNAELIGMRDQIGSIEVGKRADLVVVNGNPLKEVELLRTPWLVVKDGILQRCMPPSSFCSIKEGACIK